MYQHPSLPSLFLHACFLKILNSLLFLVCLSCLCCFFSFPHSFWGMQTGGGGGGLEEIQQDIRIPARLSAVQLQSLRASDCMAVCSNSQGYCEPRRALATCGTINHSFSCLTLKLRFLFYCPTLCISKHIFFQWWIIFIFFNHAVTNVCTIHSTSGPTGCRTPFATWISTLLLWMELERCNIFFHVEG